MNNMYCVKLIIGWYWTKQGITRIPTRARGFLTKEEALRDWERFYKGSKNEFLGVGKYCK